MLGVAKVRPRGLLAGGEGVDCRAPGNHSSVSPSAGRCPRSTRPHSCHRTIDMRVSGVCVLTTLLVAVCSANPAFKEVFRWKKLEFHYPDEAARKVAVTGGILVPENNLPLGLEVWKDKLFITVPRWKSGIPASLSYVDLKDAEKSESPVLQPYPNWESHQIYEKDNATKIVSTFRVRADECDRLWVLDTGLADILGKAEQITPPKILVYDLHTDKLLRHFTFDPAHIKDNSFFANIVVDTTTDKCDDAFAYVPDLGSYALIVYSLSSNSSFRVQHHFFYMDPLQGNFNVGGVNFQWTDGLFSLALAPVAADGSRTVYFHPLSSTMEFTVNNRVLQNQTAASDYYAYKVLGSKGPNSQATASFLDPKTGVLFYTQINKNGVGCWNSFTNADDFSPKTNHLVVSDDETMVFPNDLKVDRESNLWVLTDKLPTHIYKTLNYDEVNYRIFKGKVEDVVKGTVCEVKEVVKAEPAAKVEQSAVKENQATKVEAAKEEQTSATTTATATASSTEKASA